MAMTETLVVRTERRSVANRRGPRFDIRWTVPSVAIVSVYGEIDGANASTLTDYALVKTARCRGLIVDLSGRNGVGGGTQCGCLPTATNLRPPRIAARRRQRRCGTG